jgi:2,4-didehydro-3-deoxy-L-rhamnonate hydrolase
MQQFVRVQQDRIVIPGLVGDAGLLDLRPLVSDYHSRDNRERLPHRSERRFPEARCRGGSGISRQLPAYARFRRPGSTTRSTSRHSVSTPTQPEVFLKSISSLTGPFEAIQRGPNNGVKLDWETELAIVIGREVQDIQARDAADYIFGYVCLNDVSDRSTQVDGAHSNTSSARSPGQLTVRSGLI